MTASKNNFLDHVRLLRKAVLTRGGDLIIAGDTMQALLRQGTTHWLLYPQFLVKIDGIQQYTTSFVDEESRFSGWLPYRNKRWPLANDKIAFKNFVRDAGLRTPDFSTSPDAELSDVLVKSAASSFGTNIVGPFRSSRDYTLIAEKNEYFERFIEGQLLKIWYWNGQAICAELDNMPFVTGDGVTTVGELMIRRANATRWHTDKEIERLFRLRAPLFKYYGVNTSTVLPAHERQIIEFRYGSKLMQQNDRVIVDLQVESNPSWVSALHSIGQKLHGAIPAAERTNTVFTVDAVIDSEKEIWLLEMNSNPAIHPLVYPMMVDSIMPLPSSSQYQPSSFEASSTQRSFPQPA